MTDALRRALSKKGCVFFLFSFFFVCVCLWVFGNSSKVFTFLFNQGASSPGHTMSKLNNFRYTPVNPNNAALMKIKRPRQAHIGSFNRVTNISNLISNNI